MAVTLHLVRHASYAMVSHGLGGRGAGLHLNEAGRVEAEAVARSMAGVRLAAVLSSPQPRATETATPLAALHGLSVEIAPAFDEIDFGAWTGVRFDKLADDAAWRGFNAMRSLSGAPGGETALSVQARVVAGAVALGARFAEAEVAVVSHADVIRSLLATLLGIPLDLALRLDVSPASRSVVTLFADSVLVRAVNLPPG